MNAPLGHNLRGAGHAACVAMLALAEVDPAFRPGYVIVADAMNRQPLDDRYGPATNHHQLISV
jgi:hypothetical protein